MTTKQIKAQLAAGSEVIVRDRARDRLVVVMGAGLVGGVALAVLPPGAWARLGAALFGGGAWLTRSWLAPALLGAFFAARSTPIRQATAEEATTRKA